MGSPCRLAFEGVLLGDAAGEAFAEEEEQAAEGGAAEGGQGERGWRGGAAGGWDGDAEVVFGDPGGAGAQGVGLEVVIDGEFVGGVGASEAAEVDSAGPAAVVVEDGEIAGAADGF